MLKKSKLILFLITISMFFASCDDKSKNQIANEELEVGYITLEKQKFSLIQELSGRVKPKLVSEIRPQISGIVKERLFVEGSFVNKGDILYTIDKASYQADFNKALASLNSAKAALASSSAKLSRIEELVKFDGASKQELDDTKANYLQAKALLEQRNAELENSKIDLQRCDIKAPISGYIGISSVTSGALVIANQTNALASIKDSSYVYVDLNQSYSEMLNLKNLLNLNKDVDKNKNNDENQNKKTFVSLTLDDGSLYPVKGILQSKELEVDENTGTVTLRAEFENSDNILLSGMFVKASIESSSKIDGFLIPQQAVQRDQKANPIVTILNEDNTTKKQALITQRAIGNKWLVSSGITSNDKIIIEGLNKITPKSKLVPKDLNEKYRDQ